MIFSLQVRDVRKRYGDFEAVRGVSFSVRRGSCFGILGPNAAGKTSLAIEVATRLGAEIISADSMQVYRGMDVGTAKPTVIERRGVAHHLIDVADYTIPILGGSGRLRRHRKEAHAARVATGEDEQADLPLPAPLDGSERWCARLRTVLPAPAGGVAAHRRRTGRRPHGACR